MRMWLRIGGVLLVSGLLAASSLAALGSPLPVKNSEAGGKRVTGGTQAEEPRGAVRRALSCSQGDVQDAIDLADDGDFVFVPPGACQWTTPLGNDDVPALHVEGKGIALQGAGIGQTVITDATGMGWNNSLIRVDAAEGRALRITGFSFATVNTPTVGIAIRGDGLTFRIDHNEFETDVFHTTISIHGRSYGVIDHNGFVNGRVLVFEDLAGDDSWKRPLTLGSADAVYVEDNHYYNDVHGNAIDSNGGARWVFRYNMLVNTYCEAHGLQNADQRGTFSYELYENVFTTANNGRTNWVAFYTRGGTGVLFNNAIVNADGNPYNDFAAVQDNRSCGYAATHWGPCNGSSACDGNTPGMSGYPCRDQVGRSTDASGTAVHPQAREPLYAWNNTYDGIPVTIESRDLCQLSLDHVVEGRDFVNGVRPGYTPYVYPHPLTQELALGGSPGDGTIYLDWTVAGWTYLPPTTTWDIEWYTTTLAVPFTTTDPLSTTRTHTLTGLTNYRFYTVTLSAMVGSSTFLSDTVRVMPTDLLVYLPLVMREE